MPSRTTRRKLLRATALTGVGVWTGVRPSRARAESANEKLNVACIGVGHRGRANMTAVSHEHLVALCDVDDERAGSAYERFPKAKKYYDFRRLLDEMHNQIDAVVVSTPDHTHAVAAAYAMQLGKHCYCEKPLTHNVFEARRLAGIAAEKKLVTQLGTQHHAKSSFRRMVEIVQSGALGSVREAHTWIGGSRGGGERPKDTPPVPSHLKWDLWLGPRPVRPYHPDYCPYKWRFWWDFGTGETGNNGCHFVDLPFWALKLRHPTSVEAEGPPVHPETSPKWMQVLYEFPARGALPPVKLHWSHGRRPKIVGEQPDAKDYGSGTLFVGERGMLLCSLTKWKLLPEEHFKDFEPPKPTLPESIGHHREWIEACKTGGPTTCHFGRGATLTEVVLLGNVAYRVGEKLNWDAENLKAINCAKAEPYLNEPYRDGWHV